MAPLTITDQLRDLSSLFKLEDNDSYSVSMRDANYIVLLARGAARDIEDLQKKADALEHWRQEAGKLHSQIARLAAVLEPFAAVADYDIGADESDADFFHPMTQHNKAPRLTVGHIRAALSALERLPAPSSTKGEAA